MALAIDFKGKPFFETGCTFIGLSTLDLHVGHVGGKVQKNILSSLLWAPANVGEKYCLVSPERLVASQELFELQSPRM